MLVLARKVLWLCSLLVFAPHSAMAAMDGPNGNLKGIKIISYSADIEKTIGGVGCDIDRDNFNTSIQFVANQSTELKIVEFSERMRRAGELLAQPDIPSLSGADKEAADKVAHDYNLMPTFFIKIVPLQTQFGCAGVIIGNLRAYIEEHVHMIPTQAPIVVGPMIDIWTLLAGFVGPQQTFSNQATDVAEQMMKKLVNDWAASQ